jgi:hypothetical protein
MEWPVTGVEAARGHRTAAAVHLRSRRRGACFCMFIIQIVTVTELYNVVEDAISAVVVLDSRVLLSTVLLSADCKFPSEVVRGFRLGELSSKDRSF